MSTLSRSMQLAPVNILFDHEPVVEQPEIGLFEPGEFTMERGQWNPPDEDLEVPIEKVEPGVEFEAPVDGLSQLIEPPSRVVLKPLEAVLELSSEEDTVDDSQFVPETVDDAIPVDVSPGSTAIAVEIEVSPDDDAIPAIESSPPSDIPQNELIYPPPPSNDARRSISLDVTSVNFLDSFSFFPTHQQANSPYVPPPFLPISIRPLDE
jgi:hypothetical protein